MTAVRVETERTLQTEILWRLKAYPVLPIVTPNGLYIEARDREEAAIKARMLRRMRDEGMLVAGASDLALFFPINCACGRQHGGGALVEIKRPGQRTVLGYRAPGEPSDDQIAFAERCRRLGVNHAFVRSWEELRGIIAEWGALG